MNSDGRIFAWHAAFTDGYKPSGERNALFRAPQEKRPAPAGRFL
jgi:hypothetical protein